MALLPQAKRQKIRQFLNECLQSFDESDEFVSSDDEPLIKLVAGPAPSVPTNALLALMGAKISDRRVGPQLHKDVVELLSTFLLKGVDREVVEETLHAYPPIRGCQALQPSELNPEIKASLSTTALHQDDFLVKLQCELAAIISALAILFDDQYTIFRANTTAETQSALEKLGDPLKLLADVFHSLYLHRRFLIIPLLDGSIKDALESCPIDTFLFGEKFSDILKSSKETKRFGATHKKKKLILSRPRLGSTAVPMDAGPSTSKLPTFPCKKSPSNSLNFRRPKSKGGQKMEREKEKPNTIKSSIWKNIIKGDGTTRR